MQGNARRMPKNLFQALAPIFLLIGMALAVLIAVHLVGG